MTKTAVSRVFAAIAFLFWAGATAPAQFSADSPIGVSAGLAKLFGNVTGFTANADVQVVDAGKQETLRTPMVFALLDGKMRMDVDVTRMQGKAITPLVVAAFKQAGLDRVVSIVRLDRKVIFLVFSGAHSYVDMPLSPADTEAAQKNLQIQRTPLGNETVNGHACAKNKVLVKNAKGAVLLDATTWNATDLKDFPVQIAVQAKDNTTILRFSQIQITRPAATRFEPPAGYARYSSVDALVFSTERKQSAPPATAAAQKPKSAPVKSAATR